MVAVFRTRRVNEISSEWKHDPEAIVFALGGVHIDGSCLVHVQSVDGPSRVFMFEIAQLVATENKPSGLPVLPDPSLLCKEPLLRTYALRG